MKDVIEIQIDKKLYAKVMDFLSNDSGGAEIEFFIDSSSGWVLPSGVTSFKAKEGMTWLEWVNSEYNTYGLFVEEGGNEVDIVSVDNGAFNWGYESINGVHPEDEITPNYTYITICECSPGFQP